jgi:hypothetical protein
MAKQIQGCPEAGSRLIPAHWVCLLISALELSNRADNNLEELVVKSLKNKIVAGALNHIVNGESTINACARMLAQANGSKKVITVLSLPYAELVYGVEAQRGEILLISQILIY